MSKSKAIATVAVLAASLATLALTTGSASAWKHRKPFGWFPPYSSLSFYSKPQHPIRYYRACGYGDCPCLRSIALATRSQAWWDRYDACTG
jgi:hypothetical protein